QFGGQLLGLLVGVIVGFIVGVNVFSEILSGESINATVYLVLQVGIGLAVIGLSIYYIQKLGIRINHPKKISSNKMNITKIAFFGISFILGIAYLYGGYLAPAAHKIAGILPPENGENGNGGENGGGTVDFNTTNEYIMLLVIIMLTTAIFALLYAGIVYSINMKVRTKVGVAVGSAVILLTFYLLSQFSISEYLLKAFTEKSYSLILVFLTDCLYYLLVALITILVYHQSRRIELSIIVLFLGFTFGYGSPTNIILQIIALKWGFPNFSDNITTISDVLARTLEGLEYAGLFGMIIYPIIFYKDTIKFGKQFWDTTKKQGLALLLFTLVVAAIEILIQFLGFILNSIFIILIIFIGLVFVVNMLITSKYGKQSYTALLTSMSQATLQMSESVIPSLEKQVKLLERKTKRRNIIKIISGTTVPVVLYFLIMYVTTAITSQTSIGESIFLFTALPISIVIISFATTFFFVRDPLIKSHFSYPLKALGLIGSVIYFIYACYNLVYNNMGVYPVITIFFIPLIIIPIFTKKKIGSLLLTLAGENKPRALRELINRKDLDLNHFEKSFYKSPAIFKIYLALILTKRGEKTSTIQNAISMLTSNFPIERAAGALVLLYLNDLETLEGVVKLLENDIDPRVRDSIAYGLRYFKDLPEEIYKRVIDSQHYEDDSKVLETLKQTISILDQSFHKTEEEEHLKEEYMEEI
ncbi:MAG: HEAT repeat domain-containing protein, partial [Candidatus Thorarchaeota archaeon]